MNEDLLNDFLLEAFPNPERKGCPDDETLKAFAEDRLPPGNPVLSHVSSCSECYREYRHYRQDWKEAGESTPIVAPRAQMSVPPSVGASKGQKSAVSPFRAWAIAAGLVLVLATGFFFAREQHKAPAAGALVANSTPVAINVDLFNAVTTRGGSDDATPLEQVSLPSSVVNLSVTLPRFSQSGPYQILVSKDRAGHDVVARGIGQALDTDRKVKLTVSLDLRQAAPGTYFLATVRGSDNGTYYYPLKIN